VPHVFISYFHEDRDKAHVINGHLKGAGIETFIDDTSLHAGDRWRAEVQSALDRAFCVVALCTTRAMDSKEVLFELAYAIGHGTRVVPLRYEFDLQFPAFLASYQFLDFSRFQPWEKLVGELRSSTPQDASLEDKCREVGLEDIGAGRSEEERNRQLHLILESARRGSVLLVVGRSLIDWALLSQVIESRIRERHLHLKLALIDVNTLRMAKQGAQSGNNASWIDAPIPSDWAIDDVPLSMSRFSRIQVKPKTGSLKIYGLPFYPSHSFVAYTKEDGKRYCLQEAGMASPKGRRPYIELSAEPDVAHDSYASLLEWMNQSMLIDDRLLLSDDGENRTSRDTSHRGKLIADKVQKCGLVDVTATRNDRDWFHGDVSDLIEQTANGGEIFLVGRSMVAWANHHLQLATAIIQRDIQCTFVMADPTLGRKLRSLVTGDYAELDVPTCWEIFQTKLVPLIAGKATKGSFRVYGIPAYVPVTFSSYMNRAGIRWCSLEAGIGVGPDERPGLYFIKVGDDDVYSKLNGIYRKLVGCREPLLRVP